MFTDLISNNFSTRYSQKDFLKIHARRNCVTWYFTMVLDTGCHKNSARQRCILPAFIAPQVASWEQHHSCLWKDLWHESEVRADCSNWLKNITRCNLNDRNISHNDCHAKRDSRPSLVYWIEMRNTLSFAFNQGIWLGQ